MTWMHWTALAIAYVLIVWGLVRFVTIGRGKRDDE